jgi:hypothetical protein
MLYFWLAEEICQELQTIISECVELEVILGELPILAHAE